MGRLHRHGRFETDQTTCDVVWVIPTWARMDQLCVLEVTQLVLEGLENSKRIPFHSFYFDLCFFFL